MNRNVKIILGAVAAVAVLWGVGMLGSTLIPAPADTPGNTTRPNGTSTHHRPGATTAVPTQPAPTDANGNKLVTAISLDTYAVTVEVGESEMPWVTMTPEEAPDKGEIWVSSDTSVATVDDYGHITGVKEGTCVVTVTASANPQVIAEVQVTVVKKATTMPGTATEVTYIQGILIANKTYGLPADYNPGANGEMLAAFATMQQAAAKEDLTLTNSLDFRSYDLQADLYSRYVTRDGQAAADTYSARPGHSEHQTGLAIDLNSISDAFASTPEAAWVAKNAHIYGFIIRYPKGKEATTGYQYEPWHIRYLGVENAQKVYQSGLTLEEYLGIPSVYAE